MNRSATVLIVPLLSLLVAGLFAPQPDDAATPAQDQAFQAGVVQWVVSAASDLTNQGSGPCSRTTGYETFPELQVFAGLVDGRSPETSN